VGQFRTDRIGKSNVSYDAVAEKRIHAVASAIEELIRNDEVERSVLILQRPDGGNRDDPFDTQLFEAVNIGTEIQFRGKNAVPASVSGQECNLAALERAQYIGVGRISEWSLLLDFPHIAKAGHGIKPAASDNANFRLRQESP